MSESFCVPLEELQAAVIAKLHKAYPGAVPLRIEWRLSGGLSNSEGSAIVWYVGSDEKCGRKGGGAPAGQ